MHLCQQHTLLLMCHLDVVILKNNYSFLHDVVMFKDYTELQESLIGALIQIVAMML